MCFNSGVAPSAIENIVLAIFFLRPIIFAAFLMTTGILELKMITVKNYIQYYCLHQIINWYHCVIESYDGRIIVS